MAFVSVSPWWTVSGLGGQWLQTQMGWVSSLMMYARLMHWVSGHVSQAVFRVSGCLWTRTLTFRGVQVVSPEWRAGRLNHCDQGQAPDTRHQLRRQLGETVSVSGQWQCCVRWPRDVSRTLICHFIWTDIWSRQWHAETLILSTIYCYFKIF